MYNTHIKILRISANIVCIKIYVNIWYKSSVPNYVVGIVINNFKLLMPILFSII